MRYKVIILILFIAFSLGGCNKEELAMKEEGIKKENRVVKHITLKDAPIDSTSASQAVLHQFEVEFQDGIKETPHKNSIISEASFGNISQVIIHSPEGVNRFAVFLYEHKEKRWVINGILRTGYVEEQLFSDKEGLNIPMKKFNSLNLKLDDGTHIWTFNDENTIITISRYDRFPFDQLSNTKTTTLKNKNEAYVSFDPNNTPFLYYFDSQKLILISGNIGENQLIEIANSLPSVNSYKFPSS